LDFFPCLLPFPLTLFSKIVPLLAKTCGILQLIFSPPFATTFRDGLFRISPHSPPTHFLSRNPAKNLPQPWTNQGQGRTPPPLPRPRIFKFVVPVGLTMDCFLVFFSFLGRLSPWCFKPFWKKAWHFGPPTLSFFSRNAV